MAKREVETAVSEYQATLKNQSVGDRLDNDPWFQRQEPVLQKYLASILINQDQNTINFGTAVLNREGIATVLDNAKHIAKLEEISPYSVNRGPGYWEPNRDIKQANTDLYTGGFFDVLTASKKEGQDVSSNLVRRRNTMPDIAYENVKGWQINQTTRQMLSALKNIEKQNGWVVSYDLETSGGQTFGDKNIAPHIHEFSFVKGNVLYPDSEIQIWNSVIGASQSENEEYQRILTKLTMAATDKQVRRTGELPLSAQEKVTVTRLAKIGASVLKHGDSKKDAMAKLLYAAEATQDGIIRFQTFVGDEDIKLEYAENARIGAEFLKRAGEVQRSAGKKSYKVGNAFYEMYGWEAEMLQGVQAIQAGGVGGAPLTAIGHNIQGFDISKLNMLASSDKVSDGFKQALSDIFAKHHFEKRVTRELKNGTVVEDPVHGRIDNKTIDVVYSGTISGTGVISDLQRSGLNEDKIDIYLREEYKERLEKWEDENRAATDNFMSPETPKPRKYTERDLFDKLSSEDPPEKFSPIAINKQDAMEFDEVLDTQALVRQHLPENFYDEHDIDQMSKFGLTANTQEALVRRLTAYTDPQTGLRDWTKTFYEDPSKAGAAHMALTDTKAHLVMTHKLINHDTGILIDKLSHIIEQPEFHLDPSRNSLFMARGHINEEQKLMMFTHDAFTGEIRTHEGLAIIDVPEQQEDGTIVKKTKTEWQKVKPSGLQKGVVYKIEDLFSVDTSSEFHDIMKKAYPWFDLQNLTVVKFMPYTPNIQDDVVVKAHTPIYYVGSKQDILNTLMNNTYYIGDVQQSEDGTSFINTGRVSQYTKEQLTKWERDSKGIMRQIPFYADGIVKTGEKRLRQEAAARYVRQHDYKKDKQILEFSEFERHEISKIRLKMLQEQGHAWATAGADHSAWSEEWRQMYKEAWTPAREEFYKQLWANSTAVAKRMFSGTPVSVRHPFEDPIKEVMLPTVSKTEIAAAVSEKMQVAGHSWYTQPEDKWTTEQKTTARKIWAATDEELNKQIDEQYRLSYQRFFGYGYKKGEQYSDGYMFSETLAAQVERTRWASNNVAIIQAAIDKAQALAKGDANAAAYYYKKIWENIEDYVETETQSAQSKRLGWQVEGMYAYEFDKKYDINLRGFKTSGQPKDRIISINLESTISAEKTLVKNVEDIFASGKKLSSSEKAALLGEMQAFLRGERRNYSSLEPQIGNYTYGLTRQQKQDMIVNVLSGDAYSSNFFEAFKYHIQQVSRREIDKGGINVDEVRTAMYKKGSDLLQQMNNSNVNKAKAVEEALKLIPEQKQPYFTKIIAAAGKLIAKNRGEHYAPSEKFVSETVNAWMQAETIALTNAFGNRTTVDAKRQILKHVFAFTAYGQEEEVKLANELLEAMNLTSLVQQSFVTKVQERMPDWKPKPVTFEEALQQVSVSRRNKIYQDILGFSMDLNQVDLTQIDDSLKDRLITAVTDKDKVKRQVERSWTNLSFAVRDNRYSDIQYYLSKFDATAADTILNEQFETLKKYFVYDQGLGTASHWKLRVDDTLSFLSKDSKILTDPTRINPGDSEGLAIHKMIQSMKLSREANMYAGRLKSTMWHTSHPFPHESIVPDDKVDSFIDSVSKDIPEFKGVFQVKPEDNEKFLKNEELVSDVVDNVLLDPFLTEDTEKKLIAAGYTEQEAKTLASIRTLHRKGLKRYVRSVFEMIGNLGGTITYDTASRRVITELEGKEIEFDIPKERFHHGQVSYEIGHQLFNLPVGVYDLTDEFGNKRNLQFTSLIEKAVASQEGLMKWHVQRARWKDGTARFHFDKAMWGITEKIRKAPAITQIGLKSRSNQFSVAYEDIFKNIETLLKDSISDIDNWNAPEAHKVILRELAMGDTKYDIEHPAYEHQIVLQANIDKLLDVAVQRGIISASDQKNIIDNFTPNVKRAEKLVGQAASHGDWYNAFNAAKRNAADIEDSSQLDVTKIQAYIEQAEDMYKTKQKSYLSGLRDIGVGKSSTSREIYAMATQDDGRGRKFNTHVQLTALHATPIGINTLVAANLGKALQRFKEGSVSQDSINMLLHMSPIEGTGFMHVDVGDRIFSVRDTVQKLKAYNVVNSYGDRYLDLERKADAMFSVAVDENTKMLSFHYGRGSFVEFDDPIGHVKGMSLEPIAKRAKYEGLLKLGFFDIANDHLVSEEELTGSIAKTMEEMEGLEAFSALNGEERARRIVNLLEQKYVLSYYVQTEKANPLVKVAEMSEKNMMRSLMANTGSNDSRVAAVMQELGFYGGSYVAQKADFDSSGKLIQQQVTRTLGRVDALEIGMIDALTEKNATGELTLGDFGTAARGRYRLLNDGKELTTTGVKKVIYKHFIDENVNNYPVPPTTQELDEAVRRFYNAIMEERRQPSELLNAVLAEAGYDVENRPVHIITNNFENQTKHKDISAYRHLIGEWVYRERKQGIGLPNGLTAAGLVKKYLLPDYEGEISYAPDADTLIFSTKPKAIQADLSKYREALLESGIVTTTDDYNKLSVEDQQKVRERYLSSGDIDQRYLNPTTLHYHQFNVKDGLVTVAEAVDNANVKYNTEVIRSDVARLGHYHDRSKETVDAVKFNQRAITALSNIRADEYGKTNIKKFLDERATKYNTGFDIYENFIANLQGGEIVNAAAIDQIYRNMFNRQGGGEKLSGYVKQGSAGLEWGIDEAAVEKFVKKYDVGNGDVQKGTNIMTALLGRMRQGLDGHSIATINEAGALNLFKAFSATAANAINTGLVESEAEAHRLGFKTIKLENLLTGGFGSGAFNESLYGHNWLIDLGDHSSFGNDIWKFAPENDHPMRRYVAISANHVTDSDEFIEAIADKPQEKVKLLQDDIARYLDSAGKETTEKREAIKQRIYQRVQEIKDAQSDYWKGKKGIMAEATRALMHDAQRATASGMNLLGTESVGSILNNAVQVDNGLQGLLEHYTKEREAGKAVDISKLEINGINLVEEAKKGRHALQFNYSILSLERMHDIYNTNFAAVSDALANAGVTKVGDKNLQDFIADISGTTKEIAQTKGVEGVSAREPLQYYGSVTQRKIFFNSLASGNQAIGDFVGAQMRKEDYDSDAVVNALHKEQAELSIATENGPKRVNIEVDSAMLAALSTQQMKNAGVSVKLLDEGAEKRFKNYQVSQFFTGAGEAQRYRIIEDLAEGDYQFNFDSMDISHLAKRIEPYNEQLSKKVLQSLDITLGEKKKLFGSEEMKEVLRKQYREMTKNAALDQETFGSNFLLATGETQRLGLLKVLERDASQLGEVLAPGGSYSNLAYEALRFSLHDAELASDMVSRAGHVPTGKINRYTQNIYDIVNEVLHNSDAGAFFKKDIGVLSGQLNLVNLAIQEGFLTPKNVVGSAEEDFRTTLMPKIDTAFNTVFKLTERSTEEDRTAAKQQLVEVLDQIVVPRATNEIRRMPNLPTLTELLERPGIKATINYDSLIIDAMGTPDATGVSALETVAKKSVRDVADFLVDNVAWRGNDRNIFSFAVSHGSGNKSNRPVSLPRESAQAPIQLANALSDVAEHLGVSGLVQNNNSMGSRVLKSTMGKTTEQFAKQIAKEREAEKQQRSALGIPPVDSSISVTPLKDKVERLGRRLHRGGGKASLLTTAAVGIAAGLMTSGFAYNPSKRSELITQQSNKPLPTAAGAAFGNTPIPAQSLPEPATGLAAGSAADYVQQYPMLQFADNNLNVMRGSQPKAYMINISGNSPRGQEAALYAIQNAIGGPIPHNSTINVAVNTNYQDTLSQAQVSRMVQTAMGL